MRAAPVRLLPRPLRRRLVSATKRAFKGPPRPPQTSQNEAAAGPALPETGSAGAWLDSFAGFSGLAAGSFDAAALKAAIEASLHGVTLSRHHLTRFAMYQALAERLATHDRLRRRCLAISSSAHLARVLGLRAARIVDAGYPEHTMLALRFADASFDVCVSDQVLEHVEGNPFDAVRETFRVVKPGGFVVHTTCLLNPVHREPGDFWRFTPDALALLCRSAGGIVEEAASWGSREALLLTEIGLRTVKIPEESSHPLHQLAVKNDPDWPIHTWVVARKPG